MALQTKLVSFVSPASSGGTTAITGVGFQPVGAIIFGVRTSGTQGLASAIRLGVDDGTNRYSKAINSGLFGGVHLTDGWVSSSHSILAMRTQGLNELMVEGHIQSFDADGITVAWDFILVATGVRFYARLFGGAGVSAKAVLFTPNTATYSVTGVGFQPTALFGFTAGIGNTLLPADGTMAFGFSGPTACGQATCSSFYETTFGPASNAYRYQKTGEWITTIDSTGAIARRNIITSLDADGWTLTNTGGGTYGALALNGCAINVGSFTQNTSVGTQNVPIVAATPKAAFVFGNGTSAGATAVNDFSLSLGTGDASDLTQDAVWTGALKGIAAGSESANCVEDADHIANLQTPNGNFSSTLTNRAGLTDLANSNMRLNWVTVDGGTRDWFYAIYAASGSLACGANPSGSITVTKICTPIPGGETDFDFTTDNLSPSSFTLNDGESRVFTSLGAGTYGVTEVPPSGWSVSYAVSDGSPHDAIVLSLGESVTVRVTNTFASETSIFRVLRRWALPYDGNKRIFIPRIEIVAQMGVGNSDDPDPIMYLRISPDGGDTWGPYRAMPLGADGDTMVRAYLTRFCQGLRNPVAELICDDEVFVGWVSCVLPQDFTVGTS